MAHPQTTPVDVHAILAAATDKIDGLDAIGPSLIDRSKHENPVGARRLMHRDLRAGRRNVHDKRENLHELHARAPAACGTIPAMMLSSADRQTSR